MKLSCLFAAAMLLVSSINASTLQLTPPENLIPNLEKAIAAAQKAVDVVDPEKLPVQYFEGKMISELKDELLVGIKSAQGSLKLLRNDNTVRHHVFLVMTVGVLTRKLGVLSLLLANPISYSDSPAKEKAASWADSLSYADENLLSSLDILQTHMVHLATVADSLLEKCSRERTPSE